MVSPTMPRVSESTDDLTGIPKMDKARNIKIDSRRYSYLSGARGPGKNRQPKHSAPSTRDKYLQISTKWHLKAYLF